MKKTTKFTPNLHLKRARVQRGWSQEYVAREVGTDAFTVSRWERGVAMASPHFRQQLCALFSLSAIELGLVPEETETPDDQATWQSDKMTPQLTSAQATVLDPTIPPPLAQSLVGRDDLLRQLKQRFLSGDSAARLAINGLPGVGKTALATALANDDELRSHFSDGVLWAGLGYEPDISGLLSHWGTLLHCAPVDLTQRDRPETWAASIRTAIGQRRMLLVIDDAWNITQALAFQVGGPNCTHLVTTRFPEIARRFASDAAVVVRELGNTEGRMLLMRLAPEVVQAEPDEAQALVAAVGGLPLALTLLGNYLRAQAHSGQPRRVRAALERLRNVGERLRLHEPQPLIGGHPGLSAGAPLSLQVVIGMSDQQVSKAARTTLLALAVFPPKPNTFAEEAALAVSALPVETLDELTDAGLLESSGPERYTMHQTIADYARLQGQETEARQRLVTYMVGFVRAHEEDFDALEREQSNILAALEAAEQLELSQELLQGVMALVPFMRIRGHYTLANRLLAQAFQVNMAQQEGRARLAVLRHQASFAELRGEYSEAERYSQEGLRLARELGGKSDVECAFLTTLGLIVFQRGDYIQARGVFEDGLQLARSLGDRERICTLLIHLGGVYHFQGNFSQAEVLYQEGLTLARQFERFELMPVLLTYLGGLSHLQGRYQEAEQYYLEGLSLARPLGHREHLSMLLNSVGVAADHRGDLAQASAYFQEGLALARQVGLRGQMCLLLSNLGGVAIEQGDYVQAEQYVREGISLAQHLENRNYLTYLLTHLGRALGGQGHYEQANASFQESLDLARSQGSPWHISITLAEWGEVHLQFQQLQAAVTAFQEVLAVEDREGGDQELRARALYGLARVVALRGDVSEAARLGRESGRQFEQIGYFKAGEVRAWLHSLPASLS